MYKILLITLMDGIKFALRHKSFMKSSIYQTRVSWLADPWSLVYNFFWIWSRPRRLGPVKSDLNLVRSKTTIVNHHLGWQEQIILGEIPAT